MNDHAHESVLATETIELLQPRPGELAVDCTCGRGGHAVLLARAVSGSSSDPAARNEDGLVMGFDLDATNLAYTRQRVEEVGARFHGVHENFALAAQRVRELGRPADVVLADLGFSSNQMDDPERGLSFRGDGPLDMRFNRSADAEGALGTTRTAAQLLARSTEEELAEIIGQFGEEPLARKIARKLVQEREREPIQTTAQLAGIVLDAYGARARTSRVHPATRTFMALRIAVNEELDSLRMLLDMVRRGARSSGAAGVPAGPSAGEGDASVDVRGNLQGDVQGNVQDGWLRRGARIAIISFHSLEDRMVKQAFAELSGLGLATRLTKKPVMAGAQEVHANPRARSARLRVVRIDGEQDHAESRIGHSES